jgi:hypothetical protein
MPPSLLPLLLLLLLLLTFPKQRRPLFPQVPT